MREKFNRWPPKYDVLKQAAQVVPLMGEDGQQVRYKTGKKAGELKTVKVYRCSECGEDFRQKDVQVDHIIPAGSLKSYEELGIFAEKLFVGTDGLAVMCRSCHTIKTNKERK